MRAVGGYCALLRRIRDDVWTAESLRAHHLRHKFSAWRKIGAVMQPITPTAFGSLIRREGSLEIYDVGLGC